MRLTVMHVYVYGYMVYSVVGIAINLFRFTEGAKYIFVLSTHI